MQLVKFDGHEGTIYVNPVHVVSVKKALKDTRIETLASAFTVKEVARSGGADAGGRGGDRRDAADRDEAGVGFRGPSSDFDRSSLCSNRASLRDADPSPPFGHLLPQGEKATPRQLV